jgi:hypothetical protein
MVTKNKVQNALLGWVFWVYKNVDKSSWTHGRMLRSHTSPPKGIMEADLVASEKGGGQSRVLYAYSVTPDAAHNSYVKNFISLDTALIALDPNEDNQKVVINSEILTLDFESTKPFIVTPFVGIVENGETITSTSGTDTDPITAVNTATTGTHTIKYGPTMAALNPFRDNGSKYYHCQVTFDITNESKGYMRRYYKEMIDEESLNPYIGGFHSYSNTNQTAISCDVCRIIDYQFEELKVNNIL